MHSPSWQVPPWLQSTFRHIFSLSRVISTEAVTKFCWHSSSSIFKSANLSQSFSRLPSPVHGLPPQLCSFFSLERNTFEIWHSSGQADHSPHSSQVQSTATFLKQKLHINNCPQSVKKSNILTTTAEVAWRWIFFIQFHACCATICCVPSQIPWPGLCPNFSTCFRAWPPISPAVVSAVTYITFNSHFQNHYLLFLLLQLNILSMSCFVQLINRILQLFETVCFIQGAHGISNTFQNIQLLKLFLATFSNLQEQADYIKRIRYWTISPKS